MSRPLTDLSTLLKEPSDGVPDVIDQADDFAIALDLLEHAQGPVAADAERASGFRYGHEDWLIQLKRGQAGIFLLDPIALTQAGVDLSGLTTALAGAEWILHDAAQDLPGFADLGICPQTLFDTEIAALLLDLPHVGLAAVVEHFLGVGLAKEHSAADWSYRPLPRDWRNYAALDVELLIELRQEMWAALKRVGKQEWAQQEFQAVLDKGLAPRPAPEEPWRRTSKITSLRSDRRALAVVRELWTIRDAHARALDIAPSLLLPDAAIIQAARLKPRNAAQFRAIRSLNQRVRIYTGSEQDKMFARYAPLQRQVHPKVWKDAISRALDLAESELPQPSPAKLTGRGAAPRSMKYWREHQPARSRRLERVKQVLTQIAQDVRVPLELLVTPQIIRDLCWQEEPPHTAEQVADFLRMAGARPWQYGLVAESVSRVIL